jgi:DNA-binding protein H-NS
MAKLTELLAQKAALEKQIADTQREERGAAISQIRSLMAEHGLTLSDIGQRTSAPKKAAAGRSKVAAKYRNADTGETWSGRGLQPRWLKAALSGGKKLTDFAV